MYAPNDYGIGELVGRGSSDRNAIYLHLGQATNLGDFVGHGILKQNTEASVARDDRNLGKRVWGIGREGDSETTDSRDLNPTFILACPGINKGLYSGPHVCADCIAPREGPTAKTEVVALACAETNDYIRVTFAADFTCSRAIT
eukprot:5994417-Pyramimonas_sp.AAC.1